MRRLTEDVDSCIDSEHGRCGKDLQANDTGAVAFTNERDATNDHRNGNLGRTQESVHSP